MSVAHSVDHLKITKASGVARVKWKVEPGRGRAP